MLTTDGDEYPLMDVRLISLEVEDQVAEATEEGAAAAAEDPDG